MDAKAKTKTYLLREIPYDLWIAVKVRAAERDETVRAAILRFFAVYSK
jgi:hypothetical protein